METKLRLDTKGYAKLESFLDSFQFTMYPEDEDIKYWEIKDTEEKDVYTVYIHNAMAKYMQEFNHDCDSEDCSFCGYLIDLDLLPDFDDCISEDSL